MTGFSRASIELIPEWLAATRDLEIATGLSREEALLRARKLRHLIRERKLSQENIELDDDGKDVLHALVTLLEESKRGPRLVQEANAIYLFLRGVEWPAAEFDEKAELQRWCARIGWSLGGHSIADVNACRAVSEPDHLIAIRVIHMNEASAAPIGILKSKASEYLQTEAVHRDAKLLEREPDFVIAICNFLSTESSKEPRVSASEAPWLYRWLKSNPQSRWLLDENDYVLGALALITGGSLRQLGRREEAEEWLSKAEELFSLTVTPSSLLAYVACERLALNVERRQYKEVLPQAEQLIRLIEPLGHRRLTQKSHLIKAIILKELNRFSEASCIFAELSQELVAAGETVLLGQCLVTWGNLMSLDGRYENALAVYEKTEEVVRCGASPMTAANLFAALGECLRDQGLFDRAIDCYRASFNEYSACGMVNWAIYSQVLLAETLIRADRQREAETEILTALPVIEERGLVHEGFAAMALLKESVRRRQTDPRALRELRQHLKSNT